MRFIGILLLITIIAVVIAAQYFFGGRDQADDPMIRNAAMALVSQEVADLEKARLILEKKKYDVQIRELDAQLATIARNNAATFYGVIILLAGTMSTIIIVASGVHRAKVRAASVYLAKIGESEIPVGINQIKQGDLSEILTIAANAEALKQQNGGLQKALELYMGLADLEIQRMKVLSSRSAAALPSPLIQAALPLPSFSMRELLERGELAPGRPIHFGHVAAPADKIISIGVAGWQGSGKTNCMSYLAGALIASNDADVYVIDPHHGHDEGIEHTLKPLESSGRVHFLHDADVSPVILKLDALLTARLEGKAPCFPAVGLVIDELPRLSKLPVFDVLVAFLIRCITEVRKANMFFIGGSHVWTAKYFQGRAEIRQCLNATLILPIKKSQAELLLEDTQEKKLVKGLDEPGKGLLSLSTGAPQLVKMPLCLRSDFEELARRLAPRPAVLDIECKSVLTKEELARGRRRLNLSQAAFAAKVGLTQKQISRLESGESDMKSVDSDALARILDALDTLDTRDHKVVSILSKARAQGV